MIKFLTGALVLGFASVAMAVCPVGCKCPHCLKKAAAAKTKCASDCQKPCCKKNQKKCCPTKPDKAADAQAGCKVGCDCPKCHKKRAAKGLIQAFYKVKGMTCEGCSGAISKSLAALDGVVVKQVSHDNGTAIVDYDPKKVKKSDIEAAINIKKFKILSERFTIPVTGMTCEKCSAKVKKVLEGVDGVSVKKVCAKCDLVVVDIDPARSNRDAVVKAINTTDFKAK